MEEQDRGFPGLPGGGRPDRDGGEAHRPDQAGLHHPAAALPGCGGPGKPQGLQGAAGPAGRCTGRAAQD